MISKVLISDYQVIKDGVLLFESTNTTDANLFLKEIYKFMGLNYLKFFKMDHLSKLGFLASELLLEDVPKVDLEQMDIYLACSSSSLDSDIVETFFNSEKTILQNDLSDNQKKSVPLQDKLSNNDIWKTEDNNDSWGNLISTLDLFFPVWGSFVSEGLMDARFSLRPVPP